MDRRLRTQLINFEEFWPQKIKSVVWKMEIMSASLSFGLLVQLKLRETKIIMYEYILGEIVLIVDFSYM